MELALELERRGRRAVVINADSAQVYADLQVLSARPTPEEMQDVEHRLFGAWDGAVACSAAEWAKAAKEEIARAHAASAVPILAGGTGLYIRTLLDGIAPVPPIDPQVRKAVRALTPEEAFTALSREDATLAAMLNPADKARAMRGLEVVRATGASLLRWRERREGGIADAVDLHPLIILPEREVLYRRCDARFEQMLEHGARAEAERLLARGLSSTLPAMRAIGVPQIAGWIEGRWSRDEAVRRAQLATRQYAKRQFTWFRRQPPEDWPRADMKMMRSGAPLQDYFLHWT